MLNRFFLAVLGLLLLAPPVIACLWDRDTPQQEALGMPEVVAAFTGRFERNPPLYYEMRLARVAQHLKAHPKDLSAYDDAGVACDRLGRGAEAIRWIERKLEQMEAVGGENAEHRYRYHANLGTFLFHEWLRAGADRTKLEPARVARNHIAKAIEINPQAHFGREVYQLRAMDWIIDPPQHSGQYHPNLLGWSFHDIYAEETEPEEAHAAVRGLAGLVILGNAWESVDVFHAMNVALQRDSVGFERGREGGRNTLAYFAWLRCRELIDAGHGSLYPDSPTGEELKDALPDPGFSGSGAEGLLDKAFAEQRAAAEEWHAERTAFMMARLKAGRHPDTDPNFWEGYVETSAPELPGISVDEAFHAEIERRLYFAGFVFLAVIIGLICLGFWLGRIHWRRSTKA